MPAKSKAAPKREKYARIRQTNLPPETVDKLAPAWEQLQSVAKVAKLLKIGRNTAYRQLRRMGLIPE